MTRWSGIEKDVGQLSAKWPQEGPESQTSYWSALRESVSDLRGLMYTLDDRFERIELDGDLSDQGKARARAELASSALDELKEYKPVKKVSNAVARRIANLKERITIMPGNATSHQDIVIAAEIRALIRAQKEPEQFVFSHRSDAKLVAAVLAAPSLLSGLTQEAAERIRAVAFEALHPNEVKEIAALEAAEKGCAPSGRARAGADREARGIGSRTGRLEAQRRGMIFHWWIHQQTRNERVAKGPVVGQEPATCGCARSTSNWTARGKPPGKLAGDAGGLS